MSDLMQAPSSAELSSLGDEKGSGRSSKVLLLVAVAGGVVVLALAAFFLFFSGGGDEELGTVVPPAAQPADGGQGNGNGKQNDQKVPQTFQDTVGRDPFKALPAEAPVAEPAAEPTAPTAPVDGGTTPTLEPDYYQASLKSVDGSTATVIVNGVAYDVRPGDRFPDTATGPFQLDKISADGKTVYLMYGSESVQLTKNQGFVG
jgi:hypothetical protein